MAINGKHELYWSNIFFAEVKCFFPAGDRAGFEKVAINGKHEVRFGDETINLHSLHQIAEQSQVHFSTRRSRPPPCTYPAVASGGAS